MDITSIIIIRNIQAMRQLLKKFSSSPSIPHFRFIFPLRSKRQQAALAAISKVKAKAPALFISLNGYPQNPVFANKLHDTIKLTSQRKKVPVYTFLEDQIDGSGYYIATAGKQIIASNFYVIGIDPFCRIGEIGVPTKAYTNIKKLLEYFGIGVEKISGKGVGVWDPFGQVTEEQRQFTKKWLQVISQKLKSQVQTTRKIPKQSLSHLSHMLSPKKALSLSLVDKVETMQQFASVHFPNNKIVEQRFFSGSDNPNFTTKQVEVLVQMNQWMGMPKIVLMSMEDPVKQIANGFLDIVIGRLGSPEKMEQLDFMAGRMLQSLQAKLNDQQLWL